MQFLMSEGSGDIVDEIASVTLADNGSPTYSVAATGRFAGLSPGITTADSNYFQVAGTTTEGVIGTSDYVLEAWYEKPSGSSIDYMISALDASASDRGYYLAYNHTTGVVTHGVKSTADTSVTVTWTSAGAGATTEPSKLRVYGDRDGDAVAVFDGEGLTAASSADISSLDTETIPCEDLTIGAYHTGIAGFVGTIYEVRFTIGNLTNNSGGKNGG
jgi:hypothetical protein